MQSLQLIGFQSMHVYGRELQLHGYGHVSNCSQQQHSSQRNPPALTALEKSVSGGYKPPDVAQICIACITDTVSGHLIQVIQAANGWL